MQEALTAGLAYGFGEMKLDTIEAYTNPANTGAARLLEKNGFAPAAEQPSKQDGHYTVFTLAAPV